MTDNPIAEVMERSIFELLKAVVHEDMAKRLAEEVCKAQRDALEAAGLRVLHKNATNDQVEAMESALRLGPYYKTAFLRAWLAAPTTYTPEQSDGD